MLNSTIYHVLVVWEERSFSKAAKKLGISQPALSKYVSKLEEKLGGAIFDRSVMPLELTELGEMFVEFLQNTYDLEQDFYRKKADLVKVASAEVSVSDGASHADEGGFVF